MSVLQHSSRQRGFTIVELLIVIVVIAILAAITVVGYNGISQRARNTARLEAVRQMQQTVQLVLANHTPLEVRNSMDHDVNMWYRACFGTGHEDINNDGKGDCGWYDNSPYVSEGTQFNALVSELTQLPSMSGYPKTTASDGNVVSGPYFGTAWVDSSDKMVIEYSLEGEGQDCKFTPLVYKIGNDRSLTPQGDPKYTASGDGVTECAVVVVDEPNFY